MAGAQARQKSLAASTCSRFAGTLRLAVDASPDCSWQNLRGLWWRVHRRGVDVAQIRRWDSPDPLGCVGRGHRACGHGRDCDAAVNDVSSARLAVCQADSTVATSYFKRYTPHQLVLPRINFFNSRHEVNTMKKTWVLIADAEHAKIFERDAAHHTLTELANFVHPHVRLAAQANGGDLSGDAGKGHGRTGHAGTQFEPHTEAHAKERASFAKELTHYLDTAVAEQRCHALVLIASSPMLGELRACLNSASEKTVLRSIARDLTHYSGLELQKRVTDALQLPA